jgi:TonB family protein
VNPRSPYLASSLGHVAVLAAVLALSVVQRPPAIVPKVRIVSLGGGGSPAPRPAAKKKEAAPAPARVEPPPAPVKKPEPKKKESQSPPERLPAKAPEKSGVKPPQKREVVSKTTGPPPAAVTAGAGAAPAATTAGAAPSGVGFETDADPGPLAGYLGLLRDKVATAWAAPVTVGRKGEVRAIVFFVIERGGGAPQQLSVQTSSGDPGFDRAALRAILNAAPLAPLPASWGTESIGIRFTFFQNY